MTPNLGKSNRPELAIRKARQNSSNALLQFPSDLSGQCVMFVFKQYTYQTPGSRGLLSNAVNVLQKSVVRQNSAVLLPIPPALNEHFSIQASGISQGYGGAVASGAAANMQSNLSNNGTPFSALMSGVNSIASNIDAQTAADLATGKSNSSLMRDTMFLLTSQLGGEVGSKTINAMGAVGGLVPSNIAQSVQVGIGTAVNPKMALMFTGVGLKSYRFDWTFAPTSRAESESIKNITNMIKQKILPTYGNFASSTDRAFLNYPSVVDTYLLGVAPDHYMYFKTAMITDCVVNYAPAGLSFLTGGKPTSVTLSISMTELDIHTSEDYTNPPVSTR